MLKKMKSLLLIFCLLYCSDAFSQTSKQVLEQQVIFYVSAIDNSAITIDQKIKYSNKLIEVTSELNDSNQIVKALKTHGNILLKSGDISSALNSYTAALKVVQRINDSLLLSDILYNIGATYKEQENYDSAIYYCNNSLKIDSLLDRKHEMANTYNLLGLIAAQNKKYSKSLNLYKGSLSLFETTGDKEGQGLVYANMGFLFQMQAQYKLASENFSKASSLLEQFEHSVKYASLLNGIHNANSLIMDIEFDRQQKEKKVLIIFIVISLLVIVIIYKLYKNSKTASATIIKQKNEIELQHFVMIEQTKSITESIQYAERIQTAVLSKENILGTYTNDHLIFFKPKDIVSGDFYWMAKNNNHIIWAVADCTGHGVPGAFMSMLGISSLNEIVKNKYIYQPNNILDSLRQSIIDSLQQTGKDGEQKDGMDMTICSLDLKTRHLEFSGSNNPLYLIRNNSTEEILYAKEDGMDISITPVDKFENYSLYEIKGDKMPVAIHIEMKCFRNYSIETKCGDILYMFSDGFADQFGGDKGKKFKYKPFKKLLLENAHLPMERQKHIIAETFSNWIQQPNKRYEQTDDVLILGVKLE